MEKKFTEGKILAPLLKFSLPVMGAMFLQATYNAVDLLVVGRFAASADVSAVSTGSQLMHSITTLITGLAMGTTIALGQSIGAGKSEKSGDIVGGTICLFGILGLIMTVLTAFFANPLCALMKAPAEAFRQSAAYVAICGCGSLFIVAYNVLGSVFRGMGDSKTPLIAVFIACVVNVIGDLLFVAVLHGQAVGAALATVLAQGLSVVICYFRIRKRGLPFPFSRKNVYLHRDAVKEILRLGSPIALQDTLVSVSFLVILAIVNSIGVNASAGMGVAQKICIFIMVVPMSFSQSLSAFIAQNIGAKRDDRARRAMWYGMITALIMNSVLAWLSFFHGNMLTSIFTQQEGVIIEGCRYLQANAFDTLLVGFMFCFVGYFNGCGRTTFVMLQGLITAFCVRIPVCWIMSRIMPVSLFRIGLAAPACTLAQIIICAGYYIYRRKKALNHSVSEVETA